METIVPNQTARRRLELLSGQKISACYQCEKCTNGCPLTFAMDIAPHHLMRMAHYGHIEPVLASETIWVCASCETCTTRCPNGIDIAHIMDTLRQISQQEGKAACKNAPLFHSGFLSSIRRYGRIHELGMITSYTLKSEGFSGLLRQASLGIKMLKKGKLGLLPRRVKSVRNVKDIFSESERGQK